MLLVGVVVAVVVNAVADVVAVVDDVIKDDLMVVIVVIVKFIEFDDVVLDASSVILPCLVSSQFFCA